MGEEAALKFMHATMHLFDQAFADREKRNDIDFVIENIRNVF